MTPRATTLRGLVLTLAAFGVLAAPATAHVAIRRATYGDATAAYHCCRSEGCRCKEDPAVDTENDVPLMPALEDERRTTQEVHHDAVLGVNAFTALPAISTARDRPLVDTPHIAHTLVAQRTCLRV